MQINFDQPQLKNALRSVLFVIFLLSGIALNAQTFNSTSVYRTNEQAASAQQQQAYRPYQSTVYEPFGTSAPSQISGRRNSGLENNPNGNVDLDGWGDPDIAEPGDTSSESPVGEPWVLLFFAAVAAVAIRLRRKNVKTTI